MHIYDEKREYFFPNPGRKDILGIEWWRSDGPVPWYHHGADGKMITSYSPSFPEPNSYEARQADAEHRKEKILTGLQADTDPLTVAILDLHAPVESGGLAVCYGCDQGCSCDSPEWPCRTILTFAAMKKIDIS